MSERDTITVLLQTFPLILPEIVLVVCACVIFLGGTIKTNRHLWAGASLLALGLAVAGMAIALPAKGQLPTNYAYASPLLYDSLAWFFRWIAVGAGVVFVGFSWNEVGDKQAGDYYGCLLIVLAGVSLAGAANDLVTLFLALEMISIPTYIMLYLPRHDTASQEASVKYFLLSVFSSAILLFGFSYLYGLTGSTNITVLLHTLNGLEPNASPPLLAEVAVIMVVAGLGFKIAAVPFHFYAPDVYQGTSPLMAAVLAFVPKAAGMVALMRVLGYVAPADFITTRNVGEALSYHVPMLLWFLAAVTMFLGNLMALLQKNLRRLFAYSSIAHAGYMLIGLAAAPFLSASVEQSTSGSPNGVNAVLFYLVGYGLMSTGVFAVLAMLHSEERPVETVDDLAGLGKTHPLPALMMTVFLFSLIGIPFTVGFWGKFLIFFSAIGVSSDQAVSTGHAVLLRVLALIGVINAAIGAWYYLRLIAAMYLRGAVKPVERKATIPGLATVVVCAVLTVVLSIPPGVTWMLGAADGASRNAQSNGNNKQSALETEKDKRY